MKNISGWNGYKADRNNWKVANITAIFANAPDNDDVVVIRWPSDDIYSVHIVLYMLCFYVCVCVSVCLCV